MAEREKSTFFWQYLRENLLIIEDVLLVYEHKIDGRLETCKS